MLGYKIYFDGKKFVMDDNKTPVQRVPGDRPTFWNANFEMANFAVASYNKDLKKSTDDLEVEEDFVVKICKDCGEYFIFTGSEASWYFDKGYAFPCRCFTCRDKRRSK